MPQSNRLPERPLTDSIRSMKKALFALWMLAAVHSNAATPFDDALERAVSLAAEERYTQARAVLAPLLERHADHPRARLLDGVLRAREGRVSEAIEVFDRLRRDHPEMSEPWNHLAVLYAAEGRFDEARETLLAALERRPSAAGYTNLGDLYGKLSGKLSGELARRADPRAGERTAPGSAHPPPGEREGAALSPARDDPGRPAAQAGCLRAGGFHDRRVLAEVEEWMESRGAEVFELRRVRDRRVGSRQVYLPPLGSRAEAAAKLREIRARGVRDVAIIKSGPLENGISFGVFGSPENVRRRVAALERLGIPVRRRDDWVAVHVYYVEARAGRDPDGLLAAWPDRFPERSLERVDCR